MTTYHILALLIVFAGTFVTLGALSRSTRREDYLTTDAERSDALRSELRLVR